MQTNPDENDEPDPGNDPDAEAASEPSEVEEKDQAEGE